VKYYELTLPEQIVWAAAFVSGLRADEARNPEHAARCGDRAVHALRYVANQGRTPEQPQSGAPGV